MILADLKQELREGSASWDKLHDKNTLLHLVNIAERADLYHSSVTCGWPAEVQDRYCVELGRALEVLEVDEDV